MFNSGNYEEGERSKRTDCTICVEAIDDRRGRK